jgi:SAM-dependent methyltransferase
MAAMRSGSSACPICESALAGRPELDKTWLSGLNGDAQLVRCGECSVVYLQGHDAELVSTRSDDYVCAKIVDSCARVSEQDQLFSRRLEWARSRVPGRRVLDIGCGNGAFLLAARELGWEPSGVDLSVAARDLLATSGIRVTVASAAEFLSVHPGEFDLIHMNHSLEHITSAAETMLAARAALSPGGLVYVEVPNEFDNLVYRGLELLGRKRKAGSVFGRSRPAREPSPHVYFFNKKSLGRLAMRAGFSKYQVHARRREPWQLDLSEAAGNVAALLGAGPFLTLTAQAP